MGEKRNLLISKLHSASLVKVDPMLRRTERKLKKRKRTVKRRENERVGEKRNCPFDAKKVCPVTPK